MRHVSCWLEQLSRRLVELRDTAVLCDAVVVAGDGSSHPAHAAILAAASSSLQDSLIRGQGQLHLPESSARTVRALLNFIYTGKVATEDERDAGLVDAARSLHIPLLASALHTEDATDTEDAGCEDAEDNTADGEAGGDGGQLDMPPVPKYKDILEEQQSGGTESQTKLDIPPVPEYEDISEAEDVKTPQKQIVAAPTAMQKLNVATLLQPRMLLERLQVEVKPPETEAATATQQEPTPVAPPPRSSDTERLPLAPEWLLTPLHQVTDGGDPQQSDSEGEEPPATQLPQQSDSEGEEPPATQLPQQSGSEGEEPPATPLPQQSDIEGEEPPATQLPQQSGSEGEEPPATQLPQQSGSEGEEPPVSPTQEEPADSRALRPRSITRNQPRRAAALRLKQELLDPSESEGEGFMGLEDEEDMEEQAYLQCKVKLAAPRLLSRARDRGRRVMQAQAESARYHPKHRTPRTKSGLPKPEKPWREVYMSVPEASPQKCPLCFKLFPRRPRLLDHLRRYHFAEKDYGCSKCNKVFRNKQTLVKHMNDAKCFNDKMVRCRMCGLRCESRSAWMAHYQKVHQTASPRPHACPHCPKAYATRCGVKEHIRIVHDQTTVATYACDHCDKLFKALRDLKRHERVHTNERPYVCDVCGKAFKQISALRFHGYIHTGKKPHECALCHQAFRQKAHLTKHMRCVHRGHEEGATTLRPPPEDGGQEEVPALDSTSRRAETVACQVSQQQQPSGQCSSPQT